MTLDDKLESPSPTFSADFYQPNIIVPSDINHQNDLHMNSSPSEFDIDPRQVSIMIDIESDQENMNSESSSQVNETINSLLFDRSFLSFFFLQLLHHRSYSVL